MSDKYERLLTSLSRSEGWVTATELAARLGVTTRSVRSYVAAAKTAARPLEIIDSSTNGYRINREAFADFTAGARAPGGTAPRDRVHHIVRRLIETPDGLDLHDLADGLHVSESTVEADLRKVRTLATEIGLGVHRTGGTISLSGTERDRRRLLGSLFRGDGGSGLLSLESVQREFPFFDVRGFKTGLLTALEANGFLVNHLAVDGVVLHVAIAVDRVRGAQDLKPPAAKPDTPLPSEPVPRALDVSIRAHYGVTLDPADLEYLARLLTARVATAEPVQPDPAQQDELENLELVRRIAVRVREEYLLDLDDEEFLVRFSLHVGNMIARAQQHAYNRNPMGRSIKTSYPTVYDIAVFIASQLQRERAIEVNDDEISYIALHVGSQLERHAVAGDDLVRCILVCPGYYDVETLLRARLAQLFGSELGVDLVVTRTDVSWQELKAELVLTTLEPPQPAGENIVRIQPFLTERDVDQIRRAIVRVKRQRRRARIKDELLRYFSEDLFLRNAEAPSEESMIRLLGDRMVRRAIIDESYVDGAIERERMSSTAFTDLIAVPHAMAMTAVRTSIAIAVNEQSMPWGDSRVHVIALIAFSESDRASFQTVFDQFVEVFADDASVLELVRQSTSFATFIEKLVRLFDA
jgi:lichenan operon transcriptional antiterminator